MCLVTEHAHLKRDYQNLLVERDDLKAVNKSIHSMNTEANLEIRKLNSQIVTLTPIPIIPVTDLLMISREDYLGTMQEARITCMNEDSPSDIDFSLTSKAELDRIAPELVFPADDYINNIKDCEDYALQAQAKAADYHVSGIRLVFGDMPFGYHGFVITMDKEFNIWWLETMACYEYCGVWYKIGDDHSYVPRKVFA